MTSVTALGETLSDERNNVDQTIVNNLIKSIKNYKSGKKENQLNTSAQFSYIIYSDTPLYIK